MNRFHTTLRSIVSCITDEPLVLLGTSVTPFLVQFRTATRSALLDTPSPLWFSVLHGFEADASGHIHTLHYAYELRDDNSREILAYHWHPGSRVRYPHLHVKGYDSPVDLSKIHLPTARVSLEAVVRLLIEEMGVSHRDRPDWSRELTRAEGEFLARRTWTAYPRPTDSP